ncbi:Crossover junction endodeoxyribonuclease ruvC [Borrelia coriaceae ATCC 43381]|uniref:Crossover junction endodeoxyribonuclease ruvC n=1 Tax=Borrelia coriaceae ATCC 43381 TaxID=1408429 RepID=W5SU03_9SPIR|nr:Crossover junction endodeoxyribonuclease ruvC [Borrelia coriaceae ATCC 43381]
MSLKDRLKSIFDEIFVVIEKFMLGVASIEDI